MDKKECFEKVVASLNEAEAAFADAIAAADHLAEACKRYKRARTETFDVARQGFPSQIAGAVFAQLNEDFFHRMIAGRIQSHGLDKVLAGGLGTLANANQAKDFNPVAFGKKTTASATQILSQAMAGDA
jgi:hypothetical protein